MSLQPHQERVIAEHAELTERTQKLEAFTGTDVFRALEDEEKTRMYLQMHHMVGYRDVLAERIAAF